MSYLEELLPEFRNGAKITKKEWDEKSYIYYKDGLIYDRNNQVMYNFSAKALSYDGWKFYQEPIDWDYIIENKCLCWFWDGCYEERKSGGILTCYEDSKYWQEGEDTAWDNCCPCRRDEVTFYEEKKDEKSSTKR